MSKAVVDVDLTRQDIRDMFRKWGFDRSETEILWDEGVGQRLPGAIVRYLRKGTWQEVSCRSFPTRSQNLRQIFFFLDRVRIAEDNGVAYTGLTGGRDLVVRAENGAGRKEELLDAYDVLGASPDDPPELIKDIYKKKSTYYHPDHGGDQEKFKRLQKAYELICKSRGIQ